MSKRELDAVREKTLAGVTEPVLEIGFGTGTNLAFYPKSVQKISAVDTNAGMKKLAQKRIKRSSIEVDYTFLNRETLPFHDDSFASVVSTFTLCSIADLGMALREIRRIMKTGGKLLFLEHGLSREKSIQKWQNRLNPLNKIIGVGCHLNRDMRKILEDEEFRIDPIEEFYLDKIPKTHGYIYLGSAIKVH